MAAFMTLRLLPILVIILPRTIAQIYNTAPTSYVNPVTIPPCLSAYNIVSSCISKSPGLELLATQAQFSCICFDGSGNYVPTAYDDAASACDSTLLSFYQTTGNPFLSYVDGFCTNPTWAPIETGPPETTPTTTTGTGFIPGGPNSPYSLTTSQSSNPGGVIMISTSSLSTTGAISPPPTTTKSSSSSSTGGSGSVASTSSKAEGAKLGFVSKDGSLWSMFGSLFTALMVFG